MTWCNTGTSCLVYFQHFGQSSLVQGTEQQNKLAKEQAGKKISVASTLLRTCLYRQAYSYLLTGHLRIQQQRILLRRKTRFIKNVSITINQ